MSRMTGYMTSKYRQRLELEDWLSSPQFTHALHLAPNQYEVTESKLQHLLKCFCFDVDRMILGPKHVQNRASADRLLLVAFPEKVETNGHLHCLVDLSKGYRGEKPDAYLETEFLRIWRRLTKGSGSLRLHENNNQRVANYATKECYRDNHEFWVSWEFHPSKRLGNQSRHMPGRRKSLKSAA